VLRCLRSDPYAAPRGVWPHLCPVSFQTAGAVAQTVLLAGCSGGDLQVSLVRRFALATQGGSVNRVTSTRAEQVVPYRPRASVQPLRNVFLQRPALYSSTI